MKHFRRIAVWILAAFVFAFSAGLSAQEPQRTVQTTWQLLDYIGVDYAGAVRNGRIVNAGEYAEMEEFSAAVAERLATLPQRPERSGLIAKATMLRQAVAAKKTPADVKEQAVRLASDLLAAYPVPLAPQTAPDLQRGKVLYAANCASCHGSTGDGRGPDAKGLDPAPIAFRDADRARQRSLFGIYQVLENGVDGTAMQSFADLPAGDRWDLAFYAGTFAFADVARGKRLWETEESLRQRFPDLAALTRLTPAELAGQIGKDKADDLTAFLRANPAAVMQAAVPLSSLAIAHENLRASLEAYRAGDRARARDLALAAYLDGFEPLEAVLATHNPALLSDVEQAMAQLRSDIEAAQSVAAVEADAARITTLLEETEVAIAPSEASGGATFLGSFTILLREGLEALLIVIAMVAFLRKADRTDALPYVHGGWVLALVAGGATWFAATYLIDISGASRELTEGFGSLFAALVLVSVGVWMHGKSRAGEWQKYIHRAMTGALSKGSAWFLFGLAFIVVYREVFETILFYAALWNRGNGGLILGGALAGTAVLGAIAWAMLRYSQRLPIGEFFRYSAILIAVLAVVLTGKGVAALQEAGVLGVSPWPGGPRITMLGIFPAVEPVTAQVVMTIALLGAFFLNGRGTAQAGDHSSKI